MNKGVYISTKFKDSHIALTISVRMLTNKERYLRSFIHRIHEKVNFKFPPPYVLFPFLI
jgi:hypothetical protein